MAIHVAIEIQLSNMIFWRRFNPHALPDPTARSIEDMAGVKGLFPDGDNIVAIICGVVDENESGPQLSTLFEYCG